MQLKGGIFLISILLTRKNKFEPIHFENERSNK